MSDGKRPPAYDHLEDGQVSAWFMGPKAEHSETLEEALRYVFTDYVHWRRNYFPNDPVIVPRHLRREHERWQDVLSGELDVLLNALKADYPFYHPRYLSHMLSEQTLPSVLGWFAGMLYNPNNVTDEAAPVTVELELEVGRMVAEMLGFRRDKAWAHLTSGGTIANLEALWAARTVQFTPFALREMCREEQLDFEIKLPSGRKRPLRRLADELLLRLAPNEAIFMPRQLQRFLVGRGFEPANAGARIDDALLKSSWNVRRRGFGEIRAQLGKRPLVFVPASAHYSIAKACDVLGYGEDAVRKIAVDAHFRMDLRALEHAIGAVASDEYIAAVVAVVGTTEEGAVDPVHRIKFLRDRLSGRPIDGEPQQRPREISFWIHVDAAWGGYIASLFRGHDTDRRNDPHDTRSDRLTELALEYANAIDAVEDIKIDVKYPSESVRKSRVWWNDKEVVAAFLALVDVDSVTVDPHKLGYVPYPAGIVAFRNGVVTELLAQKANYISETAGGLSLDKSEIDAVGPFILEGSKPGAAAASCWLAHKTIPLNISGHGRIIRETLMAAGRLARYLDYHRHLYLELEDEAGGAESAEAFSFTRLYEPDTNVVCFIAQPKRLLNRKLVDADCSAERLNRINEDIYERMRRPSELGGDRLPYLHPFFISRTRLEHDQYAATSIAPVLKRVGVSEKEYRRAGLFVLRSAVMNPHYGAAVLAGKDYLRDFVGALHRVARDVINDQA